MSRILNFSQFVNERADVEIPHETGQWIVINPADYKDLEDEFFRMINTAFSDIGGHYEVRKPEDVFARPEWNYFKAVDIDGDKDFDVLKVAKITPYGKKTVAVGHDGSMLAKATYLKNEIKDMKTPGNYAEVSGKPAHILIDKNNVSVVNDENLVRNIVGKPLTWLGKNPDGISSGDGWYEREVNGVPVTKILVGEPKVNPNEKTA